MKCTVEHIKKEMYQEEFDGWKDFYSLEPWGMVADDRRHAQIIFTLQNLMRVGGAKIKKTKPRDFFISSTAEAVEQIKELLYCKTMNKPWLRSDISQSELAAQGAALMNMHARKMNAKIT